MRTIGPIKWMYFIPMSFIAALFFGFFLYLTNPTTPFGILFLGAGSLFATMNINQFIFRRSLSKWYKTINNDVNIDDGGITGALDELATKIATTDEQEQLQKVIDFEVLGYNFSLELYTDEWEIWYFPFDSMNSCELVDTEVGFLSVNEEWESTVLTSVLVFLKERGFVADSVTINDLPEVSKAE